MKYYIKRCLEVNFKRLNSRYKSIVEYPMKFRENNDDPGKIGPGTKMLILSDTGIRLGPGRYLNMLHIISALHKIWKLGDSKYGAIPGGPGMYIKL